MQTIHTLQESARLPHGHVFLGPFQSGRKEDISVLSWTLVRKLAQATSNMVALMTPFGLHKKSRDSKDFYLLMFEVPDICFIRWPESRV